MLIIISMISVWHWDAAPLFAAGELKAGRVTGAVNLNKADFQVWCSAAHQKGLMKD